MYLLLSRNNPYLEELNRTPQGQTLQKDFDGMEIDLKNRFKSKNLDMKDNYMTNNYSEVISDYDEDTSNGDSLSFISSKLKSSNIEINEEEFETKKKEKTFIHFKYYIHLLNIIASILIIISQIFCHIENDNYFFDNKYIRKIGALILNKFNFDEPNKLRAWKNLFEDKNINLTLITESKGNTLPTIITHYIFNNFTFSEINNYDILMAHNISLFTYRIDYSFNYKDTEINLVISKSNNKLRYLILSLSLVSILFLSASRYLSFFRENKVLKDNSTPFYKSKYCLMLFFEVIYLLVFQYPYLNYIWINHQLDRLMILPLSSLLSAFANFRALYFFQLINSLSIYDSVLSEKILDKFYLSTNLFFTMKAYQKSNPFISLIFLFAISCLCFSLCIRIFEMYYWETYDVITQDWTFIWNALWCVFVSMTTVGYGDFYPKTHFGRILVIISCSVGIYFISMMMIFLTQKSILSESELKSYKLITRLKIRNELKDIYSNIIFHGIKMFIIQNRYINDNISQKRYEMEYNYEKRNVNLMIEECRFLSEKLKSFDIIPTKDQLYDIAERILEDIKCINNEVNILKKLNSSFLGYTDTQVVMIKYLKKCIQNTKLMLDLIEKKPNDFGLLAEINKNNLMNGMKKIYDEHRNENINMNGINLNKNLNLDKLFEDTQLVNSNLVHYDEFFAEELAKYQVSKDEYKTYFFPLFFKEPNQSFKSVKNNTLKAMKTIKQMKELKKKIDSEYIQRRNRTNEHSLVYIENELD